MLFSPIVVSHRGLHASHVENSLLAFKAAWDAGIEWCECDVHFSAEDTPYVLHDDTLDRTSTGSGPIRDCKDSQLQALRLNDGQPVPALAMVVAAMPQSAALLVESKAPVRFGAWRSICQLLHERRWMFQSFDRQDVEWMNRRGSSALLVESDRLPGAQTCHCDAVYVEHTALNEETVATLKAAGKEVGAWTVNDEIAIRKMALLNMNMIITDVPLLAKKIIENEFGRQ